MTHTSTRENQRLLTSEHGGVLFRMILGLLTLGIVGTAIFFLLKDFGHNQQINHRKALGVSEYGLMVGLQRAKEDRFTIENIPKTSYNDGWYRVSFDRYVRGDTVFLSVNSEGHVGSATERRECILRQNVVGPDTSWIAQRLR